jgi:hypothetical protein
MEKRTWVYLLPTGLFKLARMSTWFLVLAHLLVMNHKLNELTKPKLERVVYVLTKCNHDYNESTYDFDLEQRDYILNPNLLIPREQ